MNHQQILKQIIHDLQSKVACPVCRHNFSKENIIFKGYANQEYVFQFNCPHCQAKLYAKVIVDQLTKQRIETNRSGQIATKRFRLPNKVISANDIVDLHQALDREIADLTKLF